jgi:hypothetical protein
MPTEGNVPGGILLVFGLEAAPLFFCKGQKGFSADQPFSS